MDPNLTDKEKEYLDFIKAYVKIHGGLGPSYIDLMETFEVTKATCQDVMERLKKKKAVKWPARRLRKITVLR